MRRVCVLGSVNMDLVIRSPRLPVPGETLLGGPFETHPGGKGNNQAVAAARMGARVSFVGAVGSDAYGADMRGVLAREGVDVSRVLTRENVTTGIAVIVVDEHGQNTIVVAPGSNGTLTARDVRSAAETIRSCDVLLMQLEIPMEAVVEGAKIARSAGRRVVLNAAPAATLPEDLLAALDLLVVNETEADMVTRGMGLIVDGTRLASSRAGFSSVVGRARALARERKFEIVVTLGKAGAVWIDREGRITESDAFSVKSIDSVAAGDAFVGALASGGEGDVSRVLRRACAAGALATTRRGAVESLPRGEEVDGLLAK